MRTFRKIMLLALAAGVASFLIVPLVVPFQSSGSLTNTQAAGVGAEFVEIGEIQVHIEKSSYSGKQTSFIPPVLILMHGFGASTFSWRDVIEPLSQVGDVIAYDRPAFGFTDRPTTWSEPSPYGFDGNLQLLRGLIEKYAANREVILVGHSAGGQLAAEFARLNPALVQKLILVAPAIYTTGGNSSGLSWVFDIPQIDALGPLLVQGIASSGTDLLAESYYDQTQLTQAVTDGYRAPLKVAGWERAFWNYNKASRANKLLENLNSIRQSTLLITGEFDTVVPTTDTKKLATEIIGSQLVVISNTAHLPHEENPELFTQEVISWLQK